MKQKRKTGRKLLGFLLALVLVVGLMPGMGMTALAVDADLELGEGDLESANQSRNLAVDANGVIHIVYKKTDGSIVYTKSTNSGVSFSDVVTVVNNGRECEVAVSSNGRVYVAYYNDSKGYVAYSDDGNNFTSVELSGSSGSSIHLATDGDHVYAIQQSGTALYYSSDKGVTYKSHTGWTSYAYSDVHVDTSNHKVIVLKDEPKVVCRVSEDYGVNFNEEVPVKCNNEQISVYYSTATVGSGYAYMSGQDGKIYKINYNDATATEKTVNASSVSTGRSLSSDENDNVIVGYVNEGKVYYQLSTDGGTTFEDGIAVADATAANAAINIKTGDVLFLYSKDGKIMLHREIGVIKGNVNYINDSIEGLEPNTEYKVEVLGDNDTVTATYYISSNETGNIPFIGIDKDGNAYEDLAGKKIKITKAGTSDVSDPIDIEKRPTPDDAEQTGDNDYSRPVDVSDNEVLTTENSITIRPSTEKAKQKYRIYNANGTEIAGQDWVSVGENGDITFTGLAEHTDYILKAYVPATETAPRSNYSEGVKITTMGTIDVTIPTELEFTQDGLEHEFVITTNPADAIKEYCIDKDESYTENTVKFKNPGTYTVYYKASKDNYRTVYGSFEVKVQAPAPGVIVAVAQDYNGVYDGKAHGIEVEVVVPETSAVVTYGTKEGEYTSDKSPEYTDAGTYKVFYKVTAEEYTDKTGSADISINKAESSFTKVPAANTLIYNGKAQELITAGTAEGGEVQYALGTDDKTAPASGWSTSIPSKTDVGKYYVWYKVVGDENHLSKDADQVTVTITAKTVKVKASDQTITEGSNIETGSDKASLVDACDGHTLSTVTLTVDKENKKITPDNAVIKAADGTDVTKNYNISYENGAIAIKKKISAKVTFKVANGAWDDGTTEDKTVTLVGYEGDTLKLAAAQIPSAGTKPGDTYKTGGWDVVPSADAAISKDTTYTYTYAKKDSIGRTVTFKVANGAWDDGTTADKTVTLEGHEGDVLKLAAAQIPAVGTKPGDTYKAGSWDATPSADTAITADTTYTYSYAKAEAAPANKNELSINAGFKVTQKGSKITVKWGKVEGATGYEVYVQYCGKDFSKTPAKRTTTKTSSVVSKIGGKKIDLKKNFKVYVVAVKKDGDKTTNIAKTITGHIVGRKNTKYTNVKSINLTTKTLSVAAGETSKIKANTVLVNKKKKQLSDAHASEFRYASSDESIATVDKNGKVTGVSAGTCTVYVYARNGCAKKVSVTVK